VQALVLLLLPPAGSCMLLLLLLLPLPLPLHLTLVRVQVQQQQTPPVAWTLASPPSAAAVRAVSVRELQPVNKPCAILPPCRLISAALPTSLRLLNKAQQQAC
jgi:hypothetical protein